jgi:hypothetical protein
MMKIREHGLAAALIVSFVATSTHAAQSISGVLTERPDAVVDLSTAEGVRLVGGPWRYSDARIVEIDSKGPGADLKASGRLLRTYDVVPHAGAADFDDSARREARNRPALLRLVSPEGHGS